MAEVIRLPTAASSRVRGNTGPKVQAYRKANPWPGDYQLPAERNAARLVRGLGPAEVVALAMLEWLPKDQRRHVQDAIYRLHFLAGTHSTQMASILAALSDCVEVPA